MDNANFIAIFFTLYGISKCFHGYSGFRYKILETYISGVKYQYTDALAIMFGIIHMICGTVYIFLALLVLNYISLSSILFFANFFTEIILGVYVERLTKAEPYSKMKSRLVMKNK